MEIRHDTDIVKDYVDAKELADISGLTLTLTEELPRFIIKEKGGRTPLLITHDIREIKGYINGWRSCKPV